MTFEEEISAETNVIIEKFHELSGDYIGEFGKSLTLLFKEYGLEKLADGVNLKASYEKAIAFQNNLDKESDRGAALYAAAHLDHELGKLLVARLADDQKIVRQAVSIDGPLGSFSARIDMCYLIGMLSKNDHKNLHLIRRIRNEFAHNSEVIDFSSQVISNRIRELITLNPFVKDSRGKFASLIREILFSIEIDLLMVEHFKIPEDDSYVPTQDILESLKGKAATIMDMATESASKSAKRKGRK